MDFDYNTIMGALAVIGSAIAAYLSYKIYKCNRLHLQWLAVTVAFVFVILRRFLEFVIINVPNQDVFLRTVENTLAVLSSVLFILGFWSMLKAFEDFDIVERKTKDKNQQFNSKK